MITSIARRRTFAELRRDGRRARSGSVRLSFLPLESAYPQVAFAIGRSFGNAVERNRGRRRLREAFIQAAFPTARPQVGKVDDGKSTNNWKSTDSVENPGPNRGSSYGSEFADEIHQPGNLSELEGAFLLSGNRGLLTSPFTDLVRDVDKCLEKLKTTLVS